jgi:beta-glucosidase/6-phospho-beta-glucosidase/beta-galactosidase
LFAHRRAARSLTRTFFAVLACALAIIGVAAASASARPQYRGVQLHSMWSDITNMDHELDVSQQTGANMVRVDVAWSSLEQGGKGQIAQWYVDKLDHFVNGAAARGIKVLLQLQETPCWASSAPDTLRQSCAGSWWDRGVQWYPPTNNADYGDIARWVAARYGAKLAAFEVWNEPNNTSFAFWNSTNKAATYAALVKAAYPAIKAGNASLPVLAGSLADTDVTFLNALYAKAIKWS